MAIVEINSGKKSYSICEKKSAEKIDLIEATAARDPGHRYFLILTARCREKTENRYESFPDFLSIVYRLYHIVNKHLGEFSI